MLELFMNHFCSYYITNNLTSSTHMQWFLVDVYSSHRWPSRVITGVAHNEHDPLTFINISVYNTILYYTLNTNSFCEMFCFKSERVQTFSQINATCFDILSNAMTFIHLLVWPKCIFWRHWLRNISNLIFTVYTIWISSNKMY